MSSRVVALYLFVLSAAGSGACDTRKVVLSNAERTKKFTYPCANFAAQVFDLGDVDVLAAEFALVSQRIDDGGASTVDLVSIAANFQSRDFRAVERQLVELKCRAR